MEPAEAKRTHQRLSAQIRKHQHAYYVEAKPLIPDREFDRLYRRLQDLESGHPDLATSDSPTQRVGGEPLEGFRTVAHSSPMLSLENSYSWKEALQGLRAMKALLDPGEEAAWTIEPKVDGVAVSLLYRQGSFVQGLTRGDGVRGDDITLNLRTIRSLPLVLEHPRTPVQELEVRGEACITRQDFEHLNQQRRQNGQEPFANPRNTAAGALKLLDPRLAAERRLHLIAYRIVRVLPASLMPETHSKCIEFLEQAGFCRPAYFERRATPEELEACIHEIGRKREELPYLIDGAVIKLDRIDQQQRCGERASTPRWALAYKYDPDVARTRLKDILVQVGCTGALTPVALLDPVLIAGTTIRRASLKNEEMIRRGKSGQQTDIRIGDLVEVRKAGEIIPEVIEAVIEERPEKSKPFDFLEHIGHECPGCGGPVEQRELLDPRIRSRTWYCISHRCPERVQQQLVRMGSRNALDIDQMGEVVARKLVERKAVATPLDLFQLGPELLSVLNLAPDGSFRLLGSIRARKLLQGIERARTRELERWLFALSIPHLGREVARRLAMIHGSLEAIARSPALEGISLLEGGRNQERIVRILDWYRLKARSSEAGIRILEAMAFKLAGVVGPRVARSVLEWFASEPGRETLRRVGELGIRPSVPAPAASDRLAGKSFVLTGTLEGLTRQEARQRVEDLGGKVAGAVSAKTDYLVAGRKPGSKLAKARSLDVAVIDEAVFLSLTEAPKDSSRATDSSALEPIVGETACSNPGEAYRSYLDLCRKRSISYSIPDEGFAAWLLRLGVARDAAELLDLAGRLGRGKRSSSPSPGPEPSDSLLFS